MTDWLSIFGWFLASIGVFFMLTGAVGILRLPDFFTRLHPAGVNDAMGAPLILAGLALQAEPGLIWAKTALLILFALIAGATACHALAKAAISSGVSRAELVIATILHVACARKHTTDL